MELCHQFWLISFPFFRTVLEDHFISFFFCYLLGCRETHSGITQEMQMTESCFTFQGNGYAMQQDIRNYDPRYLSLALEFKSFDANTLLFYGVNEYTVCIRNLDLINLSH